MKEKILAGILAAVLCCFVAGCSAAEGDKTQGENIPSQSTQSAAAGSFAKQVLTRDQMLSDYDAMWEAIHESYPFLGFWSATGRRGLWNSMR